VTVTGGQLMVRLTNVANGMVVADAVRIEKIMPSGAALLQSAPAPSVPATTSTAPPTSTQSPTKSEASEGNRPQDLPPGQQLLAGVLDLLELQDHQSSVDTSLGLLGNEDTSLPTLA